MQHQIGVQEQEQLLNKAGFAQARGFLPILTAVAVSELIPHAMACVKQQHQDTSVACVEQSKLNFWVIRCKVQEVRGCSLSAMLFTRYHALLAAGQRQVSEEATLGISKFPRDTTVTTVCDAMDAQIYCRLRKHHGKVCDFLTCLVRDDMP